MNDKNGSGNPVGWVGKAFLILVISMLTGLTVVRAQSVSTIYSRSPEQTKSFDDIRRAAAVQVTEEYIKAFIKDNDYRIGKEYSIYFSPAISNPLLYFKAITSASIIINERFYGPMILYYDTYLDEVVSPEYNRVTPSGELGMIKLNKSLIEKVVLETPLETITLINMKFPDSLSGGIRNGFYEIKYEGKSKLIVSHSSKKEIANGYDHYIYSKLLFAFVDGEVFQVKGPGVLLRNLEKRRKGVKKMLKPIRNNYLMDEEERVVEMLKLFDMLAFD